MTKENMQIIDHANNLMEIADENQLIELLNFGEVGQRNHFWISSKIYDRSNMDDPSLSLAIRDNMATLHYFGLVDTSYASVGHLEDLDPNKLTEFLLEGDPHHPIPNYQIVSFDSAIKACVEFFRNSEALPNSVDWEEL